jgi:hypothetical protein
MRELLKQAAEHALGFADLAVRVELDPLGFKVRASQRHGGRLCQIAGIVGYDEAEQAETNLIVQTIDRCVMSIRQAVENAPARLA